MDHASLLDALKRRRIIHEFTLKNGLKVLICPRPQTRIVSCMIWYRVGSVNEQPGETGISHFLEHLMFKGTNRYKKGEIDLLTQVYGGMNNASTHQDFTNYYFNFAADRYTVAFEIEANRMKNCLFDEQEFQSEKMVVIDELMQGKDSPWGLLDDEIYQLSYRVHPYHHPIIGWKEDLIRVNLEQVKSYYQRFYQPSNATLVIAGDVILEEVQAKVQEFFADIPAGDVSAKFIPVEPQQTGERRSILELDVNICRLSMAFHTCPVGHVDDCRLDLLDNILSYGKSSRLHQKLVEKEQECRFIFTNNDTNKTAGLYWISAELFEGISHEKVEQHIQEELDRLKEELVSEFELEKAKNIALAHYIFGCESCEAIAYAIGVWENSCSYKNYEEYASKIQEVTAEDLRNAARNYFQITNRNVSVSLPRKHPLSKPAKEEPVLDISDETEEEASLPNLPRIPIPDLPEKIDVLQIPRTRKVLENGLVLLHHYNPLLPIVHVNCFVNAGQKYESKAQAGVSSLVGTMLLQGTTRRSAIEIAQMIEATGSVLEPSSGGISCKTLRPHLSVAFDLISDCLRFPAFPTEELQKERNKMLAELQSVQDNCRRKTQQKFYELIYNDHPFGRHSYGSPETLKQLTSQDLQTYHQGFYLPNNTILAISGDVSFEEVLLLAEQYFGTWKPNTLEFPVLPEIKKQTKRQIETIPMEREQLNLYLGHLGVTRNHPDFYKLIVMDHLLGTGAGFTDRMSQKLRDEMGLAYTVYANITDSAGLEPGVFTCYIGTDPRNGEKAIQEILRQIQLFKNSPVTSDELKRVQCYLTGSYVFAFERNVQITRQMIQMERFQLPEDYLQSYLQEVLSVTPQDIQRLAQTYLDTDLYTLVLGGKTEEISLP